MPALEAIDLTHGARAPIRGFESHRPFTAKASHGSLLEGTIAAGPLALEASHGSEVELKGTADPARLIASHGSELPLEGLVIRDAEVEVSHGATATIHAEPEKRLKAEIRSRRHAVRSRPGRDHRARGRATAPRAILKGSARAVKSSGASPASSRWAGWPSRPPTSNWATLLGDRPRREEARLSGRVLVAAQYLGNPAIGRSSKSHAHPPGQSAPMTGRTTRRRRRPRMPSSASPRAGRRRRTATSSSPSAWGPGGTAATASRSARRAIPRRSSKDRAGRRRRRWTSRTSPRFTSIADAGRSDPGRRLPDRLTADDNILEHIQAVRDGTTLKIGLPRELPVPRAAPARRSRCRLSSGSDWPGPPGRRSRASNRTAVPCATSDASTLEGSIKAGDDRLRGQRRQHPQLSGSARASRLHASGASTLDLTDFAASGEKLTIEANGASTVQLRGPAGGRRARARGPASSTWPISPSTPPTSR